MSRERGRRRGGSRGIVNEANEFDSQPEIDDPSMQNPTCRYNPQTDFLAKRNKKPFIWKMSPNFSQQETQCQFKNITVTDSVKSTYK